MVFDGLSDSSVKNHQVFERPAVLHTRFDVQCPPTPVAKPSSLYRV